MKALLVAQAFGYGPASKLVEIAKLLRQIYGKDIILEFAGTGVALTHIRQNSHYFNKVIEFEPMEIQNPAQYDFVISVMNPLSVLWANKIGKKVIYVDSLFWFWHWYPNEYAKVNNLISKINNTSSFEKTLAILNGVGNHYLQYIAHRLATISSIQTFSSELKPKQKDIFRDKIQFISTGPIIDLSFKKNEVVDKKIVLISLSGMLSPLNKIKDAIMYASVVVDLLSDFLDSIPHDIEIYLTANPEVINNLSIKNERIKLVSFNKDVFLKTLNKTLLLLTPPGITTIYESLSYNVALIILPEQHYGHFPNYLRIKRKHERLSQLEKIFPEILFNTRINRRRKNDPLEETEEIKKIIIRISKKMEPLLVSDIQNTLSNLSLIIKNKEMRDQLLIEQRSRLLFNTSEFNSHKLIEILNAGGISIPNWV